MNPKGLYLVKILFHWAEAQAGFLPLVDHEPWSASFLNSALCKDLNGAGGGGGGGGGLKGAENGEELGWEGGKGCAAEMIIGRWQLPNTLCPWQHLLRLPQWWRVRWRKTAVYMPTAAGCCAGLVLCQQKMCQTLWPRFRWLGVHSVCQQISPGNTFAWTPLGHLPLLLPPRPSPAAQNRVPLPRMSSSGCFQNLYFSGTWGKPDAGLSCLEGSQHQQLKARQTSPFQAFGSWLEKYAG